MKYTFPATFLALLLGIAACGPQDPQKQIDSYRQKISEYEQKIAEIEQQSGKKPQQEAEEPQEIAVEVSELHPETFSRFFEVTGLMEAVQDAYISPETSGQIDRIPVDRGARVRKGQLLLSLDTELIEKNIAEVKTNLELATRLFEKQSDLWERKIGSEIQYLEAKNSKEVLEARLATLQKQLEMSRITAPFAGIVEKILVKEGELASPGMQLIHLVSLDRMRVSAQISETYLNRVLEGEEVELGFAAYPDRVIRARISRMGEVIDPQTRTLTMEVEIPNRDGKLKPNMLTAVRIEDYRHENALVVPSIILKDDFNGTFLFRMAEKDGRRVAEKVYVERGVTVQDRTEIIRGLNEGDQVIVRGYNIVGDGSPVTPVNG